MISSLLLLKRYRSLNKKTCPILQAFLKIKFPNHSANNNLINTKPSSFKVIFNVG